MYRSSFSTLLKLMSGLVLVLATACGGADDGGQVAIADQPEAAQPTTAASEPTPSEAQDVEPSDHEGLGDGAPEWYCRASQARRNRRTGRDRI